MAVTSVGCWTAKGEPLGEYIGAAARLPYWWVDLAGTLQSFPPDIQYAYLRRVAE